MGLFDYFSRTDITRGWVADDDLRLEFNFDDCSLNDVELGDRIDRLNALGPAEDPAAARRGWLRYFSLGLEIESSNEQIDAFVLVWNAYGDPRVVPFAGQCIQYGRALPLHEETTFVDFLRHFGEPDERDEEHGIAFVYRLGAAVAEVQFDDLDLLASIVVVPYSDGRGY
jgi:hypothetical protein